MAKKPGQKYFPKFLEATYGPGEVTGTWGYKLFV